MSLNRILCVDDEPHVLAGIERNLRRLCPVVTAVGGERALQLLRRDRDFAVIVSDMRMPEMNGAQFLLQARMLAPDAVRILLTGEADLEAVVAAVNEGHINHYARKPIDREALSAMVQRCFVEHDAAIAARGRVVETARAAAQLAMAVLGASAPDAVAHAERSGTLALKIAEHLGLSALPSVELTAWLGVISRRLPPSVAPRLVEDVLPEELIGVRAALGELRAGSGHATSVLARVVAGAWVYDELMNGRLSDDERASMLERSVDARVLDAMAALGFTARARAA
ncbi:MAG: response regulator [Archangium sp.]